MDILNHILKGIYICYDEEFLKMVLINVLQLSLFFNLHESLLLVNIVAYASRIGCSCSHIIFFSSSFYMMVTHARRSSSTHVVFK